MAEDDVELGHVVDLTLGEPSGTELVADAAIGATTLTVDYAGDFEDVGEVVLNGTTLAYTSIAYGTAETDPDVITLAAPLAAAAVVDDKVVRVSGGEPLSDWLLHVSLGDGHPVDIPIPFEQRALWSSVDTSTPVPVMVSSDLERLVEVPGRTPELDLAYADAATLDVSNLDVDSLPPIPQTDGSVPGAATTVTSIGGIGSMFYRWTEIANNDPVTYRLHVRAGSAPTTDGTYEVAAGVGLTSAAVRKLKDGTAIVGDGSVTYHAIVSVEDADGPGPASTDVTGVPAQVNTADIAANAITAGMLTANDVLADAINATDFTGVTMTAPIIRTVASGRRVEVNGPSNWLSFYSGSGSEQLPGYMEADVSGNLARLIIAAPDTDTSNKATATYRNMIMMYEDVTDASASRVSRTITARTGHFYIECAGSGLIHVDGSGTDPDIDLDNAQLRNFTAATFTASSGSVGTGTFRDSVRAALAGDYAAGAWTAYTPTLTAGATAPTLASFTRTGRYIQRGKTVHFTAVITATAASGYGTGAYGFGLPVTARSSSGSIGDEVIVHASQSGPNHGYIGRGGASVTEVSLFLTSTDAVATSTSTGMATGTVIRITGTYEAA